ncbi:MAG: hypothetical protein RSC99_06315 [Clostridiales bacterium]
MLFYDFEVFKYDWLVVILDSNNKKEHVIVNDRDALIKFYEKNIHEIWVGFNSRHYDQYILKAILCGFDPKEINDFIIVERKDGWQFNSLLNKCPINNYDVMPNPPIGLKTLEGFMGNSIKESGVPFNIDRKLTDDEIAETVKYCRHDVEQTLAVFRQRSSAFKSSMELIKLFELQLNCIGKTEAQLTAEILQCSKRDWDDEWELFIFDTIDLGKYAYIGEWFMDKKNHNYTTSLVADICGVTHTFGWGGLHGAVPKYHHKGLILHVDVNSYYPSILIVYDLISRASNDPKRYVDIYHKRMQLKKLGKKKEQEPYKKVLNAASGAMKAKFNKMYDPRNNNLMCINGQLMLLDLIDKLEGHCELIQSNTDGLIITIPDTDAAFETIDDICYEWESRTHMGLKLDVIEEIWQKDVNGYLWVDEKGNVERIGSYLKPLSRIDYDLPILNKALVEYMVHGVDIEQTVNSCNDLIDFQKIVKLSDKYLFVSHNDITYTNKSYRVFASNRNMDGKIYKCKSPEKKDKFANTPNNCFIYNDDVNGLKVPRELDKEWYIAFAKKRLRDFGVTV